ncbi:MAG TPA: hypothetical protein VGN83_15450 [Falsiroseomonas sp.]|jgi:hypothetical protein|nr:hypothetical protein [Falsiroseomonas sp.]
MPEPDFSLLEHLAQKARSGGRGSGSDDGSMLEQRVAALEADMREVKSILGRMEPLLRSIDDRLRKIEIETAEMKGRVSQLPTAWTFITAGIGLVLGTFGFIFALLRFALPS